MKTPAILLSILLAAIATLSANAADPVVVDASDLIYKVYGVADPASGREECRQAARQSFNDVPVADEGAEWMTTDEGFRISYEGMQPEAEAMARYDHGTVVGYGYIFYFPYTPMAREKANGEQCSFCAALLQELTDMGVVLGADPMTVALFDVEGAINGGDVQLTLNETVENETLDADLPAGAIPADRSGSFTLVISVVPANALNYTADNAE